MFNRSIFTVVLSAIIVGQMVSMTPNYAKAKRAANRLFSLLERIPFIDSYSNEGKIPVSSQWHTQLDNLTPVYDGIQIYYYRYCPFEPDCFHSQRSVSDLELKRLENVENERNEET